MDPDVVGGYPDWRLVIVDVSKADLSVPGSLEAMGSSDAPTSADEGSTAGGVTVIEGDE